MMHFSSLLLVAMLCGLAHCQTNQEYCEMVPNSWVTPGADASFTYFVSTVLDCYSSTQRVTVNLFSDITKPFAGFMIQANLVSNPTPIGVWSVSAPFEAINCAAGSKNMALMRFTPALNTTYTELQWIPPVNINSAIVFNATFIDANGRYFKNIISQPVMYNATCGVVKKQVVVKDICNLVPTNMRKEDSTTTINYGVEVAQNCYRGSDLINVTLYSSILTPFSGFVIAAQRVGVAKPYGMWMIPTIDKVQRIDCHNMQMNTLHMPYNSSAMNTGVAMKWRLTEIEMQNMPGDVIFNATVIDRDGNHMMNVTSRVLRYDGRCGQSTAPPYTGSADTNKLSIISLFTAIMVTTVISVMSLQN